MDRLPLVAVALLVALAGCGAFSAPVGDASTPTDASSAGPIPPVVAEVSVTAVVDGDTIRVTYPNGSTDTVRLVGIDTPEVHVRNDPTEFEGVPDTEAGRTCLREAGTDASNFAKDELLGREVGLALDPDTDRRDRYQRLLAYVVVDDRLFNYRLVATGHARVYDSQFSQAERFYEAEATAQAEERGLWRCVDPADRATVTAGASGLAIATINADAAGDDTENLNDEYLVFENRGEAPLDLAGWTVSDEAGKTYTFDALTLDPGERVTLHTGRGTDTETDRYWGRNGAVWNNGGDTVTVRDADGALVAERSYD
jgi:micrococcal nuclease